MNQTAEPGLRQLPAALPARWYFDPAQHQRELEQIWYRNWIYVGRSDALAEPLSYLTHRIGTQVVLIVRDDNGKLQAFHNTCRHRGAALCTEAAGRLPGRMITCRYHGWSYNLQGRLARVPQFDRPQPEGTGALGLYPVALRDWQGFIFVNLHSGAAPALEAGLASSTDALAHWPLASLKVGHTQTRTLQCNWKVFWENYNECLHCPGVHPSLSALVPIYRRGIMEPRDDPDWAQHRDSTDPARRGGLRAGAVTWSMNGQACGPQFPGLTDEERRVGYHYLTHTPSMYVAAHVDYLRVVRLQPTGPESTEVQAQWLFPAATLQAPGFDLQNTVQFAATVMAEDAAVCELVQQGQRALAHVAGVLMPEEYDVHNFQQWIRDELAR
jgi:Rieske 2Fe-2S family protein